MENSSSGGGVSGPLSAPSVCEEDEGVMLRLNGSAESSNLAAFNLSLNCWLHILSRESSLDLHGDSSNLPVGLFKDLVTKCPRIM